MSLFKKLLERDDTHWMVDAQELYHVRSFQLREPDGHFHPSAIASGHGQICDRYLAYTLYYTPPNPIPTKFSTSKYFRVGSATHEALQQLWLEAGLLVLPPNYQDIDDFTDAFLEEKAVHPLAPGFSGSHVENIVRSGMYRAYRKNKGLEWTVYQEYPPIKGHCDGIILKPGSDIEIVAEIKTINNDSFKALKGPLLGHRIQLNIYMGVLGKWMGMLYYENKDNQDQKIYDVEFDAEMHEEIIYRLKYIIRLYNQQTLPPRIDSTACKTCTFYQKCKGLDSTGGDEL